MGQPTKTIREGGGREGGREGGHERREITESESSSVTADSLKYYPGPK